jgi:hypothetical protein
MGRPAFQPFIKKKQRSLANRRGRISTPQFCGFNSIGGVSPALVLGTPNSAKPEVLLRIPAKCHTTPGSTCLLCSAMPYTWHCTNGLEESPYRWRYDPASLSDQDEALLWKAIMSLIPTHLRSRVLCLILVKR